MKPTNMFILSQVQACHVNVVVVAYSKLRRVCVVNCATTMYVYNLNLDERDIS